MKIIIYTINNCQFSVQERDYLKANNLQFEEKNLETNREFLAEMMTLSNNFAGTPVTKIEKDDGNIVILKGFTKEEFDQALGFAPVKPAETVTPPTPIIEPKPIEPVQPVEIAPPVEPILSPEPVQPVISQAPTDLPPLEMPPIEETPVNPAPIETSVTPPTPVVQNNPLDSVMNNLQQKAQA